MAVDAMAVNGRALCVGEIVLIVDCLRDVACELAESPDIVIIQHESGECSRACMCGGRLMHVGQT